MRAVDISIHKAAGEMHLLKASFKKNQQFYWQEALGLGIFMVSACFFSGVFFGRDGIGVSILTPFLRQFVLGILMGLTAVFIFYSRYTSPSGSHINPAVTLVFFRLGKIGRWDAIFYIIFQMIGGTATVYIMGMLMGSNLTAAPLHDVVTVPGVYGVSAAALAELVMALIMMSMVLFTTDDPFLKKYTRIIAGCLICLFVTFLGPVSGFGMNPARSFASAFPANIYTAFWIYIFMPLLGMLGAAELYLLVKKGSKQKAQSIKQRA